VQLREQGTHEALMLSDDHDAELIELQPASYR